MLLPLFLCTNDMQPNVRNSVSVFGDHSIWHNILTNKDAILGEMSLLPPSLCLMRLYMAEIMADEILG